MASLQRNYLPLPVVRDGERERINERDGGEVTREKGSEVEREGGG